MHCAAVACVHECAMTYLDLSVGVAKDCACAPPTQIGGRDRVALLTPRDSIAATKVEAQ